MASIINYELFSTTIENALENALKLYFTVENIAVEKCPTSEQISIFIDVRSKSKQTYGYREKYGFREFNEESLPIIIKRIVFQLLDMVYNHETQTPAHALPPLPIRI